MKVYEVIARIVDESEKLEKKLLKYLEMLKKVEHNLPAGVVLHLDYAVDHLRTAYVHLKQVIDYGK